MRIEAIGEVRTGARTVPLAEIPLSDAKILSSRFSRSRLTSRVADAVVEAIAGFGSGIGLDIVEGGGGLIEWTARRVNGNYRRYMEGFEAHYYSPRYLDRFFKIVAKRNRFIEVARETKSLYRKRSLPHAYLLRFLSLLVTGETRLTGHKNLDFISEKLDHEQVTGAANHLSDTDHPLLDYTLRRNGYSNVADHLVFPAGLKMWDRPQTRWGMPGMNTISVATPGYFEEAQGIAQLPLCALSKGRRYLLEQYQSNMARFNITSLRAVRRDWQEGRAMVMVYPETTRSRDGLLKRGRVEMELFFRDGWVLPMAIQGPNEVFPAEQNPRWGKLIRRKLAVALAVGEPINTKVLWFPETRRWLEAREANPVDFVMSRIAILNSGRIDPRYRPLYERLWADIPEGLILGIA